jgi:hypothetical protein
MKQIKYLVLIFVLIQLVSCKKDEINGLSWGKSSCIKNGQKTEMYSHIFKNENGLLRLEMNTFSSENYLRTTLSCGNIKNEIGNYSDTININNKKGYTIFMFMGCDGDCLLESYRGINDSTNYLYIDKIDHKKEVFIGRFSVKLQNDKNEIMTLANGVFEAPF